MTTFNIGDIVEVVGGAPYSYATPGSYGIVTDVWDELVEADFQYTPSGQRGVWSIRKKYLKLRVLEAKEVLVARKIATIYSRQRSRGIVHV